MDSSERVIELESDGEALLDDDPVLKLRVCSSVKLALTLSLEDSEALIVLVGPDLLPVDSAVGDTLDVVDSDADCSSVRDCVGDGVSVCETPWPRSFVLVSDTDSLGETESSSEFENVVVCDTLFDWAMDFDLETESSSVGDLDAVSSSDAESEGETVSVGPLLVGVSSSLRLPEILAEPLGDSDEVLVPDCSSELESLADKEGEVVCESDAVAEREFDVESLWVSSALSEVDVESLAEYSFESDEDKLPESVNETLCDFEPVYS